MKIKKIKRTSTILLAVLVISIFMLFLSASISYKQFKSLTISEKLVIHSHNVIQTVLELSAYIKDAETGQRGYLLTRDTTFLEPYTVALSKIDHAINKLKALQPENLEEQKKINTLHYLINVRFNMLAITLEKATMKFPLSYNEKIMLLSGKESMDRIRSKTNEIIDFETIKLKKREEEHLKEVQISPLTFLLTAFISLLIFAAAFFKIFKDISTLKEANNQLLINKELFGHNEVIAKISSWLWDLEENKLIYSDNHYRLLGCEPNEFEPTIENFMAFVHPDDKQLIIEGEYGTLEKKSIPVAYFRIIRKDGQIRYMKSIGKNIIDTYGKEIKIGINADITEEYHTNKMLKEKLFDLEQSNKELLAFNHVASHDLQEPLRKIQTFISRIDIKEVNNLSEDGKNYFSRIKVAASRMQNLIDDLLAFSRTNKADNVFELTDLNILLENSTQELAQTIEDKKAVINASFLPTVNVIPFQIQQLFTNLIGNALKYSKSNIIPVVTIQTEIVFGKEIVRSTFTDDNKLYKITVSDNGIGFEDKYSEDIFTLFNRLHSNSEYSGTGIGLTICKKIAENHKGFITAEGIPNVGSRFTFYLPANETTQNKANKPT